MYPNDYMNSERMANLREVCVQHNATLADLEFCKSNGRQAREEESRDIRARVTTPSKYGAGVLESLKSKIESAGTAAEADTLIDDAEMSVFDAIAKTEAEIVKYPSGYAYP